MLVHAARAMLNRNRWAMYANSCNEMETDEFAVTGESHAAAALLMDG